jgi:hypothetical protein
VADDTAAIKAAINAAVTTPNRYGGEPMIYFPTGTYLVSDSLESRATDQKTWYGWRAGMVMIGQSRTKTIIKLKDSQSGFTSTSTPKALIRTGSEAPTSAEGGGNRAFRHGIINLTVNTGTGNIGAIGIDFCASNRGTVEDVTIQSGDGSGITGLSLSRTPGPAMIKNVTIIGFNDGIYVGSWFYGMTFEGITLQNQKQRGIYNEKNMLWIRNLTSSQNLGVPVVTGDLAYSDITVVGGVFTGGIAANNAIINNGGQMLLRNIKSTGYGKVIDNNLGTKIDVTGGPTAVTVNEYNAHPTVSLNSSPTVGMNLPLEETPTYNTTDLTKWQSAVASGATVNDASNDDAVGIQAAIDSGKEVVYLPSGTYHVNSTIIIRGAVKKIIGCQASILRKTTTFGPVFRFSAGTPATVVMEHMRVEGVVEHNSSRTLSMRHMDISPKYQNTALGTGKVFFEDVITAAHLDYPQKMWARQFNAETTIVTPQVRNKGGTIWILGLKFEGCANVIENLGGDLELLGSYIHAGPRPDAATPMFINDEGKVSMGWRGRTSGAQYTIQMSEKRGGVWKTLTGNNHVPLYTGY